VRGINFSYYNLESRIQDTLLHDLCCSTTYAALRLPVLTAVQTGNKDSRGLIRTSGLQLIIGATLGSTFLASKHISRCLGIVNIFSSIAFHLFLQKRRPMIRSKFLVCHKGNGLGCYFLVFQLFDQLKYTDRNLSVYNWTKRGLSHFLTIFRWVASLIAKL